MSRTVFYAAVGAAAIVAGGLTFWLAQGAHEGSAPEPASRNTTNEVSPMPARTFAIEGMVCQGCADTITTALAGVPGVRSASVSLEDKKATVSADESKVPNDKIVAAIAAAGYKGSPIPAVPRQ